MRIRLDPLGGVAGDMFIAAILDAFPEFADGLLAALRSLDVPPNIHFAISDHVDDMLSGRRFDVTDDANEGYGSVDCLATGEVHSPSQSAIYGHRDLGDIRDLVMRSALTQAVRECAIGIFSILADAEAKVHGVKPDDVVFHEVGAWDSILDIVGAAYLITTLNAKQWSVGPLPLGSGRISCAHGLLPVPAPATALLLKGFAVFDDGVTGERVTPTGAAILRYLAANGTISTEPNMVERVGIGFGARVLPGFSNILRVIAFEPSKALTREERLGMLQFEVDDQTSEDVAVALDRLRAMPGVHDVVQMAAFGKKGRLVFHVQLLVNPEFLGQVRDACFLETTTLGIRTSDVQRHSLARYDRNVKFGAEEIRVKITRRPGGSATAKAEMSDLTHVGGDRCSRESLRTQAERQALERLQTGLDREIDTD